MSNLDNNEKSWLKESQLFSYIEILHNHFGEDHVDVVNSNETFNVIIRFDEIQIDSDNNVDSTKIHDLFVNFNMTYRGNGDLRFVSDNIYGIMLAPTVDQLTESYQHSHLPGNWLDGDYIIEPYNFSNLASRFCLGAGEIYPLLMELTTTYNTELFELFLCQLRMYLNHESLIGGPYRKISNINLSVAINNSRVFEMVSDKITPEEYIIRLMNCVDLVDDIGKDVEVAYSLLKIRENTLFNANIFKSNLELFYVKSIVIREVLAPILWELVDDIQNLIDEAPKEEEVSRTLSTKVRFKGNIINPRLSVSNAGTTVNNNVVNSLASTVYDYFLREYFVNWNNNIFKCFYYEELYNNNEIENTTANS